MMAIRKINVNNIIQVLNIKSEMNVRIAPFTCLLFSIACFL